MQMLERYGDAVYVQRAPAEDQEGLTTIKMIISGKSCVCFSRLLPRTKMTISPMVSAENLPQRLGTLQRGLTGDRDPSEC